MFIRAYLLQVGVLYISPVFEGFFLPKKDYHIPRVSGQSINELIQEFTVVF